MMPSGLDARISSAVVSQGVNGDFTATLCQGTAMLRLAPRSRALPFDRLLKCVPGSDILSLQEVFLTPLPSRCLHACGRSGRSDHHTLGGDHAVHGALLTQNLGERTGVCRRFPGCHISQEILNGILTAEIVGIRDSSRTIYPSGHGLSDSISS